MALVKCKECGSEISKKAKQCPHCGSPISQSDGSWLVVVVFLAFGYWAYSSVTDDSTTAPTQKAATVASAPPTSPRVEKFGRPPTMNPWTGSYSVVEDHLRRIANDPDSIKIQECTGVYEHADGWVVGCEYTGGNAFGGIVRKSNWFVIANGKVVMMKEPDALGP